MSKSKSLEVKIAKPALDQIHRLMLEANKEELKQLQKALNQIKKMAKDGTIIDQSVPVDLGTLRHEDPQLYERLLSTMEAIEKKR